MEEKNKCQWRPPEDATLRLKDYECKRPPDPASGDSCLCLFHIPLEQKNQDENLSKRFREEWWKLYEAGDWDFLGFEFPDRFDFGERKGGNRKPCDFRREHEKEGGEGKEDEQKPVDFSLAKFGERAGFYGAKFGDVAKFSHAEFGDGAGFDAATFGDQAWFHLAEFGDGAGFVSATFGKEAEFVSATFGNQARFDGAKFGDGAKFRRAKFGNQAWFYGAKFGAQARFDAATFGDQAWFYLAEFGDGAGFVSATFGKEADFVSATFGERADFYLARFGEEAGFDGTKFGEEARFEHAMFGDNTYFYRANFIGRVSFFKARGRELAYTADADPREAGAGPEYRAEYTRRAAPELVFESTTFRGPAYFHTVDLSRARFHQTDLSNISFHEAEISQTRFIACDWGRGAEAGRFHHRTRLPLPLFRFRRTRLLFDELILRRVMKQAKGAGKEEKLRELLGLWREAPLLRRLVGRPVPPGVRKASEGLGRAWRWLFAGPDRRDEDEEPIDKVDVTKWPYSNLTPGDVEVVALQLKQSLEATREPIAAGDFHFCAMEMKRLKALGDGRAMRAAALWLYKMVSGYGERYGRALLWLGLLVLAFAGLYGWAGGFELIPPNGLGAGAGPVQDAAAAAAPAPAWSDYLLHSLQNVLPFKFSKHYLNAAGAAARWLSFAETLLGTSLFAFFVLALRRRFKR